MVAISDSPDWAKYQNVQLTISETSGHLLLAACLELQGITGGT